MRLSRTQSEGPVWRARLLPDGADQRVVLSATGLDDLARWLGEAARSKTCRVLVLEGSSGVYCQGMDLEQLIARPEAHAEGGVAQYRDCLRALRSAPQLTVALVDGLALAGGVGLVAAMDWVIASDRSRFGLPEVVVGLVPAMVLPLLLERMPQQKARRFALCGETIDASAAAGLGLVDQMVRAEDLEPALRRLLRQSLRLQPEAVGRIKALCREPAAEALDLALDRGAQTTAELLRSPARIATIAAFLAGEKLPWFASLKGSR